jgi:hypothetical protein
VRRLPRRALINASARGTSTPASAANSPIREVTPGAFGTIFSADPTSALSVGLSSVSTLDANASTARV